MTSRLSALALLAATSLAVVAPAVPAVADPLPYKDTSAVGSIGFCDVHDHPVTSGKLADAPFVWKAIASSPAPKGFTDSGAKATLYAFQPRNGVDPGDWSGSQLTAASSYSNPAHPVAQSTYADGSLLSFVQAYTPAWKGLVELRLYFTGADRPAYSVSYPATSIQVSGNSWKVVDPRPVTCSAGKGLSIETTNLPASRLASPTPAASASPGSTGPAASSPTASQSDAPAPSATAAARTTTASTDSSDSGSHVALIGLLVAAVVALGGIGWFVARRRT